MRKGQWYYSLTEKILDFIANRVELEDGCWVPPCYIKRDKQGYIRIWYHRGTYFLHREVLRLVVLKRRIRKGYMTCHKCLNKDCFNPNHLYEGTAVDNGEDRVVDENGRDVLSNADVRFIREGRKRGMRYQEIADILGIKNTKRVQRIATHRTYKKVT